MESFFFRFRNQLVLLAFLAAQIIGLATQVRRSDAGRGAVDTTDGSGVRLVRLWANAVVSPPERAIHYSLVGIQKMWTGYFDLRYVLQQNQNLTKTVDQLRLEQAALLEDARQGQRLQAMLGFQERYIYSTVAAQVYGTSGSDQSKVFYIDKGSNDGLKKDMAVISADGIVGKVRDVFQHSAQVLVVNDQTSGAGVILETTRIRGILKGDAAGNLEMVGLLADDRIKPGEKILTAGGDLIFPRGLPVGTVLKVVRDPDRDSFIDVIVSPAAHLEQLDEVLVITSTEPRFSADDQNNIAASETLKGPEVEAQQKEAQQNQLKESQIMAERLPGLTDAKAAPDTTGTGQSPAGASAVPPAPAPAPKLLPALHPDRFSPSVAKQSEAGQSGADTSQDATKQGQAPQAAGEERKP
jgi:rod shape-determining protein MreC